MKRFESVTRPLMWLVTLLLFTFVAGCNGGKSVPILGGGGAGSIPTVSFTAPANGATAVAVNSKISVAFSEVMNSATLTPATFLLTGPGGVAVAGTVGYVGTTATFTPTSNLANSTLYTATITTGAKDVAGDSLVSDYVFSFTTGAIADVIPPTVSVTSPTATATDVPINRIVTVGFSEAMDPLTVTAASVTMKEAVSGNPVMGTVTPVGTSMTFKPAANLASSTLYTVTISPDVKDLAGNAMLANYVFSFTTSAIADIIPPTVSLTTPANGQETVPVNRIVSVGFSEAMDPLSLTTATFTLTGPGATPVIGTVTPIGTSVTFTPNSKLANSTLYTATISNGARDLAGNAMVANYVFTFTTGASADIIPPLVSVTSPAAGQTAVPVNRVISAGFSEAMDPLSLTTATFTLTGPGATPVIGTVTPIGTSVTFTPNSKLANSTLYTATISSGARDLAGNAMVANYVFTFTTGASADIIPPLVSVTSPAAGQTAVPVNRVISVGFSEAMDPLSLTTASFTLSGPGATPVIGTVTPIGTSVTFTPNSKLANSTLYTATISSGARDLAGNAMVANYVFSFTTGAVADITPPTVSFTTPANGETSVHLNRLLQLGFSEAMDPLSLTTATFTLTGPGATPVTGTVTPVGNLLTFTPLGNLANGTLYTATITTGAKDLAGNALASNYVYTFTTSAAPLLDNIPPTVVVTVPNNGQTAVPVNRILQVGFSEVVDPSTVTAASFTLTGPGATPITGAVSSLGSLATFTPSGNLANSTLYTATITTGVKDSAGNAMVANYVFSFTTGAALDTTPPTVTVTSPTDTAIAVPVNRVVNIAFSEAMDPLTITTSTVTLKEALSGNNVLGIVVPAVDSASFTPLSNLANNTKYVATVSTGVKDLAGNAMVSNYVFSFTTGSVLDTTPPIVTVTSPTDTAIAVPVNTVANIAFSKAMDPLTLTNSTVSMKEALSGNNVLGTVVPAGSSASFTPLSSLANNTKHVVTVSTGVKDLAGNAMVNNYVFSFTTGGAADIILPTVITTYPLDLAINVPVGSAISATFSEPMNQYTIHPATFRVNAGNSSGPLVAGVLTSELVTNSTTFTPSGNLAYTSLYTATITNQVTDMAGNAMLVNKVWTFTTAGAPPPPVAALALNLGKASTFGIAAGAGLTSTGITVVTGDIALTPTSTCTDATGNAGAAVPPPGCALKTYGAHPTGLTVTGSVYFALDPFDNGVTANNVKNDLHTAWLEGRAKAVTRGTVAGDQLASVTPYAPGVYHNANLGFSVGGVATLDGQGDVNAVFIFQVDTDFTGTGNVGTPSEIKLINGTQAKNVWFVVGRDAVIGDGTIWKGNVLAGRDFTVNIGAKMLGRALSGAEVGVAGAISLKDGATVTVP